VFCASFTVSNSSVVAGDYQNHYGAVEKYFSGKVPDNVFVLDFAKPKGALDTAYPMVKQILGKHGYVSQVGHPCRE
jgi:hypothetical protein